MKTKKSVWSIVLSLVLVLALALSIGLGIQKSTVNAQDDEHITFNVLVDNETLKSVSSTYSGEFTVSYYVTESTGVDALQLKLGYDHDKFTLVSVVTNDETALGAATKGVENYLDNVVYENTNENGAVLVLNSEDESILLITAVFEVKEGVTLVGGVEYEFGFYNVNDTEEEDTYSTAWRIEKDTENPENPATHEKVEILFANIAKIITKTSIRPILTGIERSYNGQYAQNSEITINLAYANQNFSEIEQYNLIPEEMRPGIDEIAWFEAYETEYNNYVRYRKLSGTPKNAGTYYVAIRTSANDYFEAYCGWALEDQELFGEGAYGLDAWAVGNWSGVATYIINPLAITITMDNQTSAYGDAIVSPLTYTQTGTVVEGENLHFIPSTTATSQSNVGTYPITMAYDNNGNYNITVNNGVYTITQKAITITALDQSANYTGNEPTVDQTKYTVTGVTSISGVVITKAAGVNVGEYTLTPSLNNSNYTVTAQTGVFTITSVGKTADYVKSFFSGATITYDVQQHDLLVVSNEKPNWISYTASNNNQTNANTYQITVTATVSEQDAKNYIDASLEGDQEYVATVYGTINPYAVTVTADNKSHVYGNTPATLTPVEAGLNGAKVTVTFTVKANEETITLSTTTPVGTYTIVPSATNSNYSFTFNNGQYTVSKGTASVEISANDIDYNREYDCYEVVSAKVGGLNVTPTITIRNANGNVVYEFGNNNYANTVLDAGTYYVYATIVGTDNYDGAEDSAEFDIEKVLVAAPTVEYNGATATWSVVSEDSDGVDLYNSTVTYTIGGTEYANRSFTATAKGTYTLVITPSNTNYMVNEVELNPVYSVTFTEGDHPANTATPTNMPAVQYVFEGEQATQPATNPSLTGYTFDGWDFDFSDYIIGEMVENGNRNIPALWIIQQRTMTVVYVHSANNTYVETSKTFKVNYNTNVVINTSNFIDKANITDIISQYNLNGMRYTFNGFWNYKITGEDEYIRENVTDIVVNATENFTFVALYNATPLNYEITYYFSIDGADYTESIIENDEYTSAAYGSNINYITPNSQKWFRVEAWYLDAERTQAAPEKMPAQDITVYGALVFNVGKGDVNGDGNVDANDITLYRRWIVGGYEITELLNNEALYEASELETEEPSDTVYFIARVADTNAATYEAEVLGDNSLDIRDVSTIRMGLVGGYGFSIVEGKAVTGEDLIIARDFVINNASDMLMLAASGAKVTLTEDITDATLDAEILDSNNDIIIDLNGHTLTLKSFRVTLAQGNTGKILVTNGRVNVADGNGVYLTAVDGSVHLDNVTLYDDNGLFVIQTADHSLHLFNVVRFLKKEIVNNEPVEAPAQVLVVKDSHIVVEEEATVTIEKVVVAEIVVNEQTQEEEVVPVDENSDAEITINIQSEEVEEIPVQGDKFKNVISNEAELLAAAAKGGSYKVVADFTVNQQVNIEKDFALDGDNHTITANNTNNGLYVFYVINENVLSASFSNLNIVSTGYQVAIMTNLDAEGSLVNVNNVDITCDGECIYANGFGVVNANNCEFTRNGKYAQGKDDVYYSALTVGYAGTINATNCTVTSDRNGVSTFPSGGTINLTNVDVTVTANDASAIWARNEDYNVSGYEAYCLDSVITINGGNIVGGLKLTDKYTTGNNNYHEPVISITAGTFSNDPTAYVAQGYYAEEVNNAYVVKQGISNQAQLLEAAANGGSYKVVADFTVNQQVNIEKDFALDGDNHTITANNTNNGLYVFYVISENVLSASFSNLNIVSTGYQVAIMTNLDAEGSLVNVNNVDITCDGECIYANGFGVVNANNCGFTRNGKYAQGKDDVYYSALTVGYAGTINATNCTVTSDRNGVATFPSGGTINLTNVDVTVTANDASAIWARNEDYNVSGYEAYCLDSVITINGGNIVGGLKLTDKYTTGNNNYHEPRIVITAGTFDNDPTAYVAEGYNVDFDNSVYTVYEGVIGAGENGSGFQPGPAFPL